MNTPRDLSKRLLKLFPVKILKDHFNSERVSEALYEDILNRNIKTVIDDFAYMNLEYTRQHIYIFDVNATPSARHINLQNFPFTVIKQRIVNGIGSFVISPIVDFKTILTNPFEEVLVKFHQPMKIMFDGEHLVFYVTIMEKNIGSYIDNNRNVVNSEKDIDELNITQLICQHFSLLNPCVCDLNGGIKFLWRNDLVDSKYVKWKKDRSTTTEAMDENFTLKSQYPNIFQDLINDPLKKTVFKYLRDDDLLPDHFAIDPAVGQISVPLYSKNADQNENLVREILSNN
jgi:hypothetical protein